MTTDSDVVAAPSPATTPRTRLLSIFALFAPLLVSLRSLSLGFVTDDYGFRAALTPTSPHARQAWDLFRFVDGDPSVTARAIAAGALPWWTDPALRIHFLRPLAGLSFWLDDRLFGDRAVLYHVDSLLWFLALLLAARALFRVLLSPDRAAWATLFFGLSHANAAAFAWPSARHAAMGGTFALLALSTHLRAAEVTGGRRFLRESLALFSLVLGLLSSESALAVAAPWVFFELAPRTALPWKRRLAAITPVVAVSALYLVSYRSAGGGAFASGGYHDPLSDPLGFLRVARSRLPELLGDALAAVPVELAMKRPTLSWVLGVLAVSTVVACAVSLRALLSREDRRLVALSLASLVPMLLVGATGHPSSRVLIVPNALAAIALSTLFGAALSASSAPLVGRALASILALLHVAVAPLSTYRDVVRLGERARASEAMADTIAERTGDAKRVIVVAASDPYVFLYPRAVLAQHEPTRSRCWALLSAARSGHRITRVDDRTLVLEALNRPLLDGSFDTLFRAGDRPLSLEDSYRTCGIDVRVTEMQGGLPSRLSATFERPLDHLARTLFVFREGALVPFPIPAIGDSETIPWSPGPTGVL